MGILVFKQLKVVQCSARAIQGGYFGAAAGLGTPVGASGYVTNTRTVASTNIINEAASAITSFFRSGTSKSKTEK